MSKSTDEIVAELRNKHDRILNSVINREVATPADGDRAIEAADLYREAAARLEQFATALAGLPDPSYSIKLGDVRCPFCREWGRHNGACAWHQATDPAAATSDSSSTSVDVLAEAMGRQTFIADWHEKAEGVIVDLAVHGWRLTKIAADPAAVPATGDHHD